jgi:hypothetical protein
MILAIFKISFFVFLKILKLRIDFSYKIFHAISTKQTEKTFFILSNDKLAIRIFHNYLRSYFLQ